MAATQYARLEISLAAAVAALGIVLTSWAVLAHAALLVAPGALLITVGGAWLGNAVARRGVRLFTHAEQSATETES
jgi:hypothetical protein